MSRLKLAEINDDSVILIPNAPAKKLFGRFQKDAADLNNIHQDDQALSYALARVRSLDPNKTRSVVRKDSLTLSHDLVAEIEEGFAAPLGLPPIIDGVTFAAKLHSTLGSNDARLEWWWERSGRKEGIPRRGAFLFPDVTTRRMRIPNAIYHAITLASNFDPNAHLEFHWRALAEFRSVLGDVTDANLDPFLDGLKIITIGRVGIDLTDEEEARFAPIPFASEDSETLFSGASLASFQNLVDSRGIQPTYRLADGTFAVVDKSAAPVLSVIAEAMKGDFDSRQNFIRNAPRLIAETIEQNLRSAGKIDDATTPETAVELIERIVDEGWAETSAWSDRVIGIGIADKTPAEIARGTGLPWLPATISETLGERLGAIQDEEVADDLYALKRALLSGQKIVNLSCGEVPVNVDIIEALERRLAMFAVSAALEPEPTDAYLPIVHANLHDLDFFADVSPRSGGDAALSDSVTTELFDYQIQSYNWQVHAWKSGLPGVLNADEQGLGKTLQTLSLLAWLNGQMEGGLVPPAPVLIVAPTSLLRNWQDEIELHLANNTVGPVHRLYGTDLGNWRKAISAGRDIGDGEEHLDLSRLQGRQGVVITTYQTLANYAVSFAGLKCAAAIFDEMQFIKNPRTQRAQAAKAVQADFFVGLTGTPIENKTQDLWSIFDIIAPGALGPLARFNRLFASPSEERIQQLQNALFTKTETRPALCLRRTKIEADPTIPAKVRLLYPREMPPAQAIRYDEARAKTGGILQVLQHIRRVSAHPGMIEGELTNDFVGASARTQATMDILRYIRSKGERALVFVENRDIQAWFIEILNLEFDLNVKLINGDTSIDERRNITQHFQRKRGSEEEFDILVLGPRAAGTGLTLTAANHVIHLTRWWNPAVEEQCNDRTHRIGQSRPVTIHLPLAIHPDLGPGSFDCLLHLLIMRKVNIASSVLQPSAVAENELQQLYAATIAGELVDDEPKTAVFADGLPDRDDLTVTWMTKQIMKISSDLWPGSILIATNQSASVLSTFVETETRHAILIDPPVINEDWDKIVPLSVVKESRLWPDYILPF